MKIKIENKSNKNIGDLMRGAGYKLIGSDGNQLNFVHRIASLNYPRFHVYMKEIGEEWEINLHLDQKKPVYKGVTAHSGEYEGGLVEQEVERIKGFFQNA